MKLHFSPSTQQRPRCVDGSCVWSAERSAFECAVLMNVAIDICPKDVRLLLWPLRQGKAYIWRCKVHGVEGKGAHGMLTFCLQNKAKHHCLTPTTGRPGERAPTTHRVSKVPIQPWTKQDFGGRKAQKAAIESRHPMEDVEGFARRLHHQHQTVPPGVARDSSICRQPCTTNSKRKMKGTFLL